MIEIVRRRIPRVPALLVLLLVALPPGLAAGGEEGGDAGAAARRSALVFEGSAVYSGDLEQLGRIAFRYDAEVRNPTAQDEKLLAGNLLLVHPGGWLQPLDPETLDGSYFRGSMTVPAGKTIKIAGQMYAATTSPSHTLLAVRTSDGHAEVVTPIVHLGHDRPAAWKPSYPFGVGVVGPLQALRFSDGRESVLLVGQHQVLDGRHPTDVHTTVMVGGDKGSLEPVSWDGLDAKGDRSALWPFVRRIDVYEGMAHGFLRINADAVLDGHKVAFVGSWPVTRVQPVALRAPVLGTWQLSNGPGSQTLQGSDGNPKMRYAYDFVVLEQGRTHRGDPHRNESYFAWNRSVRAAADGEVVDRCDAERDNPGYRGALTVCYNNRVVVRHADGVYTAYLHIRQRSIPRGLVIGSKVEAGQVIARVGNSGESSEPHLRFLAFRVDATDRWVSVPLTFRNAYHDTRGKDPVQGVPLGGGIYHFKDEP
jgi:hypothetical protein